MRIILIILLFSSNSLYSQLDSAWKKIIITPDLLVYFPDIPQIQELASLKSYEFNKGEIILKVTSEKSPLNYYGRTVKEVDDEFYGSLTAKTITPVQKLLSEENFKFENHNVRKLIYTDTIDNKPCTVTLEILNVTGFEEAMYKFYLIDFKNRNSIPEMYHPFFSNWDLYYKLENSINDNPGNENKVLKEKGFIIEGERNKGRKRKKSN